jgi:hypothetical protein
MDKPADFIERTSKEFEGGGVDVATVAERQDPKTLLFGPPATEAEPDEFFKWDAEKELDGQKGAFYVDVENTGRMERFWGRTRTEVAKNLAEGKKHLNKTLAEVREAQKPRQPDTKLPFDPIQRKQPRELTQQESLALQDLPPAEAQARVFEARTGYTMEDMARSIALQEENRQQIYAATVSGEFVTAHQQDFAATPGNMTRIDAWLKERKLPVTRNNLEIAFMELGEKLTAPSPATPEFTPPPPPVSPPSRPAPGSAQEQRNLLSREQVAAIQSGSLSDARTVIQEAFRANRGSR